MGKLSKKLISIITTAVVASGLTFSSLPPIGANASTTISTASTSTQTSTNAYQASNYGLADKISDGIILHAWCWSFNTIKANMKAIAESGYTSVQTSPVSKCAVGAGGDLSLTNWYYHYQPTNYTVGNYQLGTEDEFKAMCTEAHKYGVNIVVDVVANHMTSNWSLIDPSMQNRDLYHTNTQVSDWNNRQQVTQLALLGLWDMNTQSPTVQQKMLSYLKQCVADGADGFRFDAAKHIELPDDSGFGGNFWPTVLNNGAKFQYGEILQDGISREGAYANYMSVTASNYGKKIRDAIGAKSFNASSLSSYEIGVGSNKIVTWVESHDNYANSPTDWGASSGMNDWQVKMAWGVVAARSGGTPLFFSRPVGGGNGNRFPGTTKIGDKGSDLFMDSEVVAVNKFHNAMIGQSENLSNINGSNQILSIGRGNKGQVIINLGNDVSLSGISTNLSDGAYTDQVSSNKFVVSGGKFTSGTALGGKMTVLYNAVVITTPSVSSSVATSNFDSNSLSVTLSAKNVSSAQYSIDGGTKTTFTDGTALTLGSSLANGASTTLTLYGTGTDGSSVTQTYTYTKKTATYEAGYLYVTKASGWGSTMYAYVYDESSGTAKTISAWPGVKMTYDSDAGRYYYKLPTEFKTAKTQVIFNDGTNQVPASKQPGAYFTVGKALSLNGTTITTKDPTSVVTPVVAGSITTDKTSPQVVKTTINIATEAATGGAGGYTYQFSVNGTVVQDYSASTSTTWTPTAAGNYTITVISKDSAGIAVTKTATYVIKLADLVAGNVTTDKASPQTVNAAIKVTTSAATGGAGGYTYQFSVNGNVVKAFSTSTSATWTPTAAGTYTITVTSKDSAGNTVTKTLTYVIKAAVKPITITSVKTSVASPQKAGTAITITANATSGIGSTLKYQISVYEPSAGWKVIKSFSSTNTAKWAPTSSGACYIWVDVRDASGNVATTITSYDIQ